MKIEAIQLDLLSGSQEANVLTKLLEQEQDRTQLQVCSE